MTSSYEGWVRAAVAPARRLEPSKAEVAHVLAQSVSRGSSDIYRWRFFWTWRSVTLAVVGLLLAATTAAAITMLIAKDDNNKSDQNAKEAILSEQETSTTKNTPDQTAESSKAEEKHASKATVSAAYKELDVVARDWYVRTYANVAAGMFAAEKDKRLARFCGFMSSDAKRETVAYARDTADLTGFKWTCPSAVALLIRRGNQGGTAQRMLRAKVIGVNLKGNHGTATLDFGSGPQSTVPLVKEEGKWKLGSGSIGR